jgi:hypothetical protein
MADVLAQEDFTGADFSKGSSFVFADTGNTAFEERPANLWLGGQVDTNMFYGLVPVDVVEAVPAQDRIGGLLDGIVRYNLGLLGNRARITDGTLDVSTEAQMWATRSSRAPVRRYDQTTMQFSTKLLGTGPVAWYPQDYRNFFSGRTVVSNNDC